MAISKTTKKAPVKKAAAPKKATSKAPAKSAGKSGGGDKAKAFLAAIKGRDDAFKKGRTAKAGTFDVPEIDDGTYLAQVVKASVRVAKNQPAFSIDLVVTKGEFEGVKVQRFDVLGHGFQTGLGDDEKEEAELRNMESFCKNVQGCGIETEKLVLADLPELADSLTEDKPFIRIGIKNWSNDSGKRGLNVFLNQLVDEEGNDIK